MLGDQSNTQTLYKHKNCHTVVVEVVKFHNIRGKKYCRIKVRWYSLQPSGPQDMRIETWLTNDEYGKSSRDRRKYNKDTWYQDWEVYNG